MANSLSDRSSGGHQAPKNKKYQMKREALEQVIDKHISNIEKHSKKLPGTFDKEDIHDLRVNYKKVRAFLRLLQLEKDAGDLHISDKLKSLYHHCGTVRDWQLFLEELHDVGIVDQLPDCMHRWHRQVFTYKEQTVHAIETTHFKKLLHGIIKELPRQLQEDTVKQFMHQKIAAIHILLLAAENEKDLHSIRKQIKDIIYCIRIFKSDWGIPFPFRGWKSEKELNEMASSLGDFNDQCLAISLLQPSYICKCDYKEQHILRNLQINWLHQKEARQRQLLYEVQELHVEHAF
ncbi:MULTISPECIES: CHAD domain-containing protein [Niastella]|uniref:CHAD domain-containing protein n=1 Tax=Niastella soli TaxID=2821487 RepID=A0ABS3YR97_9BACT|nr:CHAD domain-containing protein [Niastella soli]MBO9200390.1 CHAD domain-containing protein [Niastella soli]